MPRARTIVKNVARLSPAEYRVLHAMNLQWRGSMQWRLSDCRDSGQGQVIVHYDETFKIDGWSLVFEDQDCYDTDHKVAYFYVPEQNRRKGIGTKIMKRLYKIDPAPYVVPWEDRSAAFFRNFNVTCNESDRRYYKIPRPTRA